MCMAIGALSATEVAVSASVATTVASMAAQMQEARANASMIQGQEQLRQNQIAEQAGNAESVAAKEARAAQAQSIVAAGAAGVNLGSNSFLASVQTTAMNASQTEGMIQEDERNSESASIASADSELATKGATSTFIGAGLDAALSGASAYASADMMENMGKNRVLNDNKPPVVS